MLHNTIIASTKEIWSIKTAFLQVVMALSLILWEPPGHAQGVQKERGQWWAAASIQSGLIQAGVRAQISKFFAFSFQECCLCNLRGGALKMTVGNRLVFLQHSFISECVDSLPSVTWQLSHLQPGGSTSSVASLFLKLALSMPSTGSQWMSAPFPSHARIW